MSEPSNLIVGEPFRYEGLDDFISALEDWLYPAIQREWDRAVERGFVQKPDAPWHLHMGVLVFGKYVDTFIEHCIPSLLAPGNLDAVNRPTLIIYTDKESHGRLLPAFMALNPVADVSFELIPQTIIDHVFDHEANKYWLLSAMHNVDLQTARYRWSHYHMLMPDHVYAEGYFANLKRLSDEGKQAIVQCNIHSRMEAVGPVLKTNGGRIQPKALVALALDNMHQQMTPFVMNGREGYPGNLCMVWVAEDRVAILNPHMSIVFLSREALRYCPLRMFNTIDGQLPFLIPEDVEPYVPTPDDGMVYSEISDDTKPFTKSVNNELGEFCARFWLFSYCHFDHIKYADLTTVLGLPEGYRGRYAPMALDDIHAAQAVVRRALRNTFPHIQAAAPSGRDMDPILRAEMSKAA